MSETSKTQSTPQVSSTELGCVVFLYWILRNRIQKQKAFLVERVLRLVLFLVVFGGRAAAAASKRTTPDPPYDPSGTAGRNQVP
eukprot:2809866-Rhodomonas_salina.2